jgi:hypothetical protein
MSLQRTLGLLLLSNAILMANGAALAQAPTPAIDVVGIKLGMPMADGVAAIKANNPKLSLQTENLTLEGFDQPFATAILANQPTESGHDGEEITLLLTTPPNHQVVWGIQRTYHYRPQSTPSLDNTIAGLRKKYGAENAFPLVTDPRIMTKIVAWAYDTGGKMLGPAQGRALFLACDTYLGNHFSSTALSNDLHGVGHPSQCDTVILATATAQAGQSAADGTAVVSNLIFKVTNGAMYRASLDATRAVAVAAAQAREKKQAEKVDQRGGPKL